MYLLFSTDSQSILLVHIPSLACTSLQLIYAGPVDEVESYFAKIGLVCPPFIDCGDFLQLLSTGDESSQMLYDPAKDSRRRKPQQLREDSSAQNSCSEDVDGFIISPPTIDDLAELFRQSDLGARIRERLNSPHEYLWKKHDNVFSNHQSQVSMVSASRHVKQKYANSFFRSTCLILQRFLTLWIRDQRVIIAAAFKNVIMGVSVGGVFFSTVDTVSIEGALFQAGLFIMLGKLL